MMKKDDSGAPKLSPIPQSMLDLLADGKPHKMEELRVLVDELAEDKSVHFHLNAVRRHLSCIGQAVLCEGNRKKGAELTYRIVSYARYGG